MLRALGALAAALAPSARLVPDTDGSQWFNNETVSRIHPIQDPRLQKAIDPCVIDPSVCSKGKPPSQEGVAGPKGDAPLTFASPRFPASLRLTHYMLNLYALANLWTEADAVLVYTGGGEEERLDSGIHIAERLGAKLVYICGTQEATISSEYEWTAEKIEQKRFNLGYSGTPRYRFEVQGVSKNTKDQSEQVVSFLKGNPEVKTAILVATSWHLPRAYLTLVSSLMAHDQDANPIRVLPMVAARPLGQDVVRFMLPSHGITPRSQSSAADSEQEHIPTYMAKGDVATEAMLERYLKDIGAWW
jgi:hypothetical protein